MNVVVSRTGYTGELGYEIYLTNASRDGVRLWDAVLAAGEPHGLAVIGPCHIKRIEAGILALGCDMWFDTNPYEVEMGYEWMVDLEQEADFMGKEALKRIKAEGVSRKLVGVEIGGPGLGSYNDSSMIDYFQVSKDGKPVGQVTSACYSPRLEKNIGYAMLPIELTEFGTELEVETPSGTTVRRRRPEAVHRPEEGHPEAGGRDRRGRGGVERRLTLSHPEPPGTVSAERSRTRYAARSATSSYATARSAGAGVATWVRSRRHRSRTSSSSRSGDCAGRTARRATGTRGADSAASAARAFSGSRPGANGSTSRPERSTGRPASGWPGTGTRTTRATTTSCRRTGC